MITCQSVTVVFSPVNHGNWIVVQEQDCVQSSGQQLDIVCCLFSGESSMRASMMGWRML